MINSRRLISNATVSIAQTVISGLVLFLLYRYLIDHLGTKQLGLWSVILASTSVARLSDMGLTGSVVKFVARYHALKDDKQAAEVIQTAAISIASVMAILALAIYPLLDDILKLSIPIESMPLALTILPWAIFSLWSGSVNGVFQSGLDGCQRMDIRNMLMIVGNLLFFGAALWLVPRYGLMGLAIGQTVQGLIIMIASWLVLRHQLTTLPWLPIRWSKAKFKEMFGYAINFQINTIALLLFEPVTKLLMSRYGGLSSAAYYEMASQLIVKLRALIISANQALVPTIAELHETAPEKVRELYLKAYRLSFFVILPFYTLILIALPTISVVWIGYSEVQFLLFGTILVVGWGLNNLIGSAYFLNLGTGDLNWTSIAHVIMAILNVVLGLMLGSILGGLGVVISAMTSLVIASGVIIFAVHKRYKIPFRTIIPAEHYKLLIVVCLCIVISTRINVIHLLNQNILLTGLINLGIYLLMVGIAIWFHPYKTMLSNLIKEKGNISE